MKPTRAKEQVCKLLIEVRVVIIVPNVRKNGIELTELKMTDHTAAANLDGFAMRFDSLFQREINPRHVIPVLLAVS
jgi:hypothetical protein